MTIAINTSPSAQTQELVDRIHEIGPLLLENAIIADQQRRPVDSTVTALGETGAFDISTLARYGGAEGGARMLLEAARAIGYYDPAAAWITVISNGSVMLANRLPGTVLDEVFDAGPVKMASIFTSPHGQAIRDGEGYRVSGEWPFGSNIHHSEWTLGIVPMREHPDAEPMTGFALLHKSQYAIKNSWFTIGMRGTGSDTMVVEDQWIPADRIISFAQLMGPDFESDQSTSIGQRLAPMVTMATTIAAPSLGGAEAARDYVRDKAHQRGVSFTVYTKQVMSGAFVKDVAHAAMKIESAALQLQQSADTLDQYATGLVPMPRPVRAECRGRIGAASFELADALNDFMWAHGTSAFAESSLLGRMWRDVNTGIRHGATAAPFTLELYGDGLLGIDYISEKI